jgi:hypothetical protein
MFRKSGSIKNEEVNGILIQKLNKEIELERLLDAISFSV